MSIEFYESDAWQGLRYRTLRRYGRKCMSCGASGVEVHVDHIKPRSKYPHLGLDPDNLQVLCKPCNMGKSNKFEDDLRGTKAPTSALQRITKKASEAPSLGDVRLALGVLRGGVFRSMIEEAQPHLPKNYGLFNLAEHQTVQLILFSILEGGHTAETFLNAVASGQENAETRGLLSTLLVGEKSPASKHISEDEFRIAVYRGIHRCWARASQHVKGRLRDAEIKNDKELQARFADEFISIKRRMKEFESFYDEQ